MISRCFMFVQKKQKLFQISLADRWSSPILTAQHDEMSYPKAHVSTFSSSAKRDASCSKGQQTWASRKPTAYGVLHEATKSCPSEENLRDISNQEDIMI